MGTKFPAEGAGFAQRGSTATGGNLFGIAIVSGEKPGKRGDRPLRPNWGPNRPRVVRHEACPYLAVCLAQNMNRYAQLEGLPVFVGCVNWHP